jgi:hypothetical protein
MLEFESTKINILVSYFLDSTWQVLRRCFHTISEGKYVSIRMYEKLKLRFFSDSNNTSLQVYRRCFRNISEGFEGKILVLQYTK